MKNFIIIAAILIATCHISEGKSRIVEDFEPLCDTLATLLHERSGVKGKLALKAVMKRKSSIDFYFTESLGDFPWYKDDVKWFRKTLKGLFPEEYSRYRLGEIYSRKVSLEKLAATALTFDGRPSEVWYRRKDASRQTAVVNRCDRQRFSKGLSGRHITLWQSHGRYYDCTSDMWKWQRPCLFQTCEDMFTQGFVLPFLVPMLENAGAYVMLPRERDIQTNEIIADNDTTYGCRGIAEYTETGKWSSAGEGFADLKPILTDLENPFTSGTARQALCVSSGSRITATARWTPEIPQRGEYAVYISYTTTPNSSSSAHYTVRHLGGTSEFIVNQKMGGGTWIYLGTFEFAPGKEGHVTLDNRTPKGYLTGTGSVVTADAVRFGGGMGNIARSKKISPQDSTVREVAPTVSGLPRYAEGARYWLQWAGADSCVYYQNDGANDYKDDFMSRGDWVEWISRGSRVNPSKTGGPGIPVDLSLGFHTDAGVTPDDSIVGTLTIYSYRSDSKTRLPAGEDRLTSRMYADMVQSQIIRDLREQFDSLWSRRSIWDRGYRESRTPSCPAMLLELLSHQNFADMKYGLDPSFRFAASRAVYKGMLKYLSCRYGFEYAVQPLPVSHIGVRFSTDGTADISWSPTEDPLEKTASAKGYILYTRRSDGAFDCGVPVEAAIGNDGLYHTNIQIPEGEIMSFRIAAYNDGGLSFPSETVSIGIPKGCNTDKSVLIVNNFDRISGPAWFDTPTYAGFDNSLDSGVPYIRDITFTGKMYNNRRNEAWVTNSRPGFGASHTDKAGQVIAGNTFDYAFTHGQAIMAAGYPFHSCSNERFCSDSLISNGSWTVDLICGKQVTTDAGINLKYSVFPKEMQEALRQFCCKGGNLIASGAYIGTDLCEGICHAQADSTSKAEAVKFADEVLGYRFAANSATACGKVSPVPDKECHDFEKLSIVMEQNPEIYCVESPNGIVPSCRQSRTIYRYEDSGISAGILYEHQDYKTVCLGFPLEVIKDKKQIYSTIGTILELFRK